MKYFCEACERLVPPAAYRLEEGLLVLKCSRCKVEMRCGPEQDGEPAPAPASRPKTAVIALDGSEIEPDPIENEPTRPITVPPSVLELIDAQAQKARGKAQEPEAANPPSRLAMSEAAAAPNLMALRLADVQSRAAESAPAPAASELAPSSGPPLRVVKDPAPAVSVASEDPFMPPPGFCPKCVGARKEGAVVCPFCGLEYARFRLDELRPSPVLSSTWLGVLEQWESKGAHDKVLALASEKGELAALGRLYRIRQARLPEDAMAKRGREEVLRLAAAGSGLTHSAPPDRRAKLKVAGLALLFMLLLVAAVLIAAQAHRMLGAGGP
ncbi:MAG: hypothetical protein ACXU86_10845 [Archangium sp.]